MSNLSDALKALKNVILLEERMEIVRRDIAGLNGDIDDLSDYLVSIDKRVVRIETMMEMSEQQIWPKQIAK